MVEEMEYFLVIIAILNVVSVIVGYFDGRKEDVWVNIVKAKNKQIQDVEFELNKMKNTNQELNMLNIAFSKMFADNKH